MTTHCDRCGKDCRYKIYSDFCLIGELIELKSIYSVYGVKLLCKKCGDKANSFINYWGHKKKSDIYKLMRYLQSGPVSRIKIMKDYNALMSAGYY